MKRLAVLLICVFVVSLLLPCVTVEASTRLVPHEDPSAAQSSIDSYSFLSQYAQVFALVSSGQYANASSLSEQLSLISLPPDLTYILNRYNNLTQQFINVLTELNATLDNASALLGQNRLDEAATNLDKAGILVSQAKILLSSLQDATTTLSQQMGVLAAPAQSKIVQAYNSLQSILQRLTDLINQYHTLQQNISAGKQTKVQQLQTTSLTLSINSTDVSLGGHIYASGTLTSNGQVLPDQPIALFLGNLKVANGTTNSTGSFAAIMTVPYSYVHAMICQALYTPTGDDANTYEASLSSPLTINVTFYNTYINDSLSDVAYPGFPLIVNGSVTSQNGLPLSGRTINILLDNSSLNQGQSDSNGTFFIQTVINPQTLIGSYNFTIAVDPSGIYAGVTQQKTIDIKQPIASKLNVQAPSFVIIPSQIRIKGTVETPSGPLNNANVTVEFDSAKSVTRSSDDGSFIVALNVPLNAGLGGFQNLNITVQPQEPGQSSTQKQTNILVLNTAGLAVAVASSVSVTGIAYMRLIKNRPRKEPKIILQTESSPLFAQASEIKLTSSFQISLADPKGKLLDIYKKAALTVQKTTGIETTPEMTLNEFCQEAQPKLRNTASQFSELTRLAEKALYSIHIPEEQDLLKAEILLDEIRRALEK